MKVREVDRQLEYRWSVRRREGNLVEIVSITKSGQSETLARYVLPYEADTIVHRFASALANQRNLLEREFQARLASELEQQAAQFRDLFCGAGEPR